MLADDRRGDQELWESAVRGEADAFGSLFERHHLVIYNFCFRRTGSWSTAEDLMSVVFLEAWRTRRDLVLSDGSLLPWLYAIATRVTSHTHRSRLRYRKALARVAARRTEAPDHADEVVDRLADEQRMRELHGPLRPCRAASGTCSSWRRSPTWTTPGSGSHSAYPSGRCAPGSPALVPGCGRRAVPQTAMTTRSRRHSDDRRDRPAAASLPAARP